MLPLYLIDIYITNHGNVLANAEINSIQFTTPKEGFDIIGYFEND